MLILTRGEDDAITIGDYIEITVLCIKGKSVRIGINAPRGIEVHRAEVYVKVQHDNVQQRRISDPLTDQLPKCIK